MKFDRRELDTIPNKITALRLLSIPVIAYGLYKNPKKFWKVAAVAGLTDMEGSLARLGDGVKNDDGSYRRPPNPRLQDMGFRGSKIGKKGDPFTDVAFGSALAIACMKNGFLPKWLGAAYLAQRVTVMAQNGYYEARGVDIDVPMSAKVFEYATMVGMATIGSGESANGPVQRQRRRAVGITLASAGLIGKTFTIPQYRKQGQEGLAALQQQSELEHVTELALSAAPATLNIVE